MFEQTIELIREKLGMENEEGDTVVEFDAEALQTELDLIQNIKGSILEMEVADEGQEVDPMNTLRNDPNILFFKNEEAGFLNAAIQTKKLIDQIVHLNVPQNTGFDLSQMMMNAAPKTEEEPDVVEGEARELKENTKDTNEDVPEAKGETAEVE